MALIVEDGTGKPDAESYISVADATAYFAARGNETWAALADDTAREVLLRKATDYMQAAYAGKWAGQRVSAYQALDWPRAYVARRDVVGGYGPAPVYWPNDEVPETVRRACAELAVRAAAGDLSPDLTAQVKQETVGPISVTYADGARQSTAFRAVDSMLSPFFLGGGTGQVAIVRA
jgi:hypothetical protein